MRRKDKEIKDLLSIESIIKKAKVCRLAMSFENKPYIVPLSFGYENGILYFHGFVKGQKIDFLSHNPYVCFEFDLIALPIESENACDWSMKYQSVIGFGRAVFVYDLDEKRNALNIIMSHYSDKKFELPEKTLKITSVIKVEIESLTGKQSGL